ncbi:hypothetical protein AVEN_128889-1 [Araneus ventricosus]|uniref:Uncharacterized protein n=1 Tax=Araneus ventricosus TaxID=182803 RepID=A0A4Y2Q7W4_ARAVE|nr:hypothetical protein AVEN_128889-1 [Araneus ventricosus]
MWRLNEFNLSHKSHTVVRLAVHLPQKQPIVYQDGQEAQATERAALRKTTLTSWFELNKNDPSAHNISYSDIPQYYVFDKSTYHKLEEATTWWTKCYWETASSWYTGY